MRCAKFEEEIKRIDEAYLLFVNELSSSLKELLINPVIPLGIHIENPDTSIVNLPSLDQNLTILPFFFRKEFSKVSIKDIRTICIAGTFGALSVIAKDRIVDSQISVKSSISFLSDLLYTKSLRYFHSLFSYESNFWNYLERFLRECYNATLCERSKHQGKIMPYTGEEFCIIAQGKSAPNKIPISALCILGGDEKKILPIARSLDYFAVASQLVDDLKDLREDYLNQRYSFLLTQIIRSNYPEIDANNLPCVEDIMQTIFCSDILESTLEDAEYWIQKATYSVEDIQCPEWKKFLDNRILNYQKVKKALIRRKISCMLGLTL